MATREAVLVGRERRALTPGRVLGITARFVRKYPMGAISAVIIAMLVITAVIPGVLAPYDPLERVGKSLLSPGGAHMMGTDQLGRDVLSRVIYGARVSLMVGVIATGIGAFLGLLVGTASAFFGGKTDLIVQRVMDGMMSIPGLILAMTLVMVMRDISKGNIAFTMMAIGFTFIPYNNRVIRSAVLSVKENDYVSAARALGATDRRIMARHIIPNVIPVLLILVSVLLGAAILVEASLSYLGLGTQPPQPSWGNMLSGDGRAYMQVAPWIAIFPGIAVSLVVLSFNLLGDTVRDIIDPRLRGTQ